MALTIRTVSLAAIGTLLTFTTACGRETSSKSAPGIGGATNAGGTNSTGGVIATGGIVDAGGTSSKGGTATGGTPSQGGTVSTGGALVSGGAIGAGGAVGSGGIVASGGDTAATGGSAGTVSGGVTAGTGGTARGGATAGTGGTARGGAVAGTVSSGGATTTTGGTVTGGTGGRGGTVSTAGTATGGVAVGGVSGNSGGSTGGRTATGGAGGRSGELVAFPGAEGFGRLTPGGRGGSVCHVTNLNDSGAGSLRDCVSQGNRTVVFDMGGWITLASGLGITANNITIAGQTAPGGGIGVRGYKLSVGGHDVIVRFLRARRGTLANRSSDDAMCVNSDSQNVIVDHCSVSFSTDENLSVPGDSAGPPNVTIQWSLIAWGLQTSNHSAGSLTVADGHTVHHSLWAFNKTRNPKAKSQNNGVLDWVNNVVYGWNARDPVGEASGWSLSYHPFLMGETANGMHYANAVGNYFISARSATTAFVGGQNNASGVPTFNLYFQNNLLDGNANGQLDVSVSNTSMVAQPATILTQRLTAPQVATDDPLTAYNRVLAGAGATLPQRDEVDALVVSRVKSQTGDLIQTEADLVAAGIGENGYGVLASGTRPANFDTDRDGMPDAWETANGLNPNSAADGAADRNGDGYTNLEDYLNSLVPPNP